ncbi:tripartite tricarboxylate transporter TctB family protein [uncultured Friedmanniella sp.]|uniref:tripartite tricarboxylate transporter TctB family protein n=1 Tax=uncultured Friedmanniella sp. TaxID=335381 RepID=UPI0035C9E72E
MSSAILPDASEAPESPDTEPSTPASAPPGRNYGELALSVLLLALGLYVILDATTIAVPGSSNTVGPRFFPYLVGAATVAVGAVLGIRILRGDQGPAEEGEDIDPDAATSWRAVGIIAVAFLAHALLINVVGWPLAVTAMFGVVAWALGARGILRPLLAGGLTSVIVWLIFVKALGVVLPGGILLELATGWL